MTRNDPIVRKLREKHLTARSNGEPGVTLSLAESNKLLQRLDLLAADVASAATERRSALANQHQAITGDLKELLRHQLNLMPLIPPVAAPAVLAANLLEGLNRLPSCILDAEEVIRNLRAYLERQDAGRNDSEVAPAEDPKSHILVTDSDLPTRARNGLLMENLESLSQVCRVSEAQLFRLPNLGRKSIQDIKDWVALHGCELAAA